MQYTGERVATPYMTPGAQQISNETVMSFKVFIFGKERDTFRDCNKKVVRVNGGTKTSVHGESAHPSPMRLSSLRTAHVSAIKSANVNVRVSFN